MGRVYQPEYTKSDGKGGRVTVKISTWYIEYRAGGKTHRKKIGTKAAANSALAKYEEAETRRRAGIADPVAVATERARPLAEFINEYAQVLVARGTAEEYRATTTGHLTRILSECQWHVWGDIDPDNFIRFCGRLRDEPRVKRITGAAKKAGGPKVSEKAGRKGCGPATLNSYMRTAKAFARWLADRFGAASPLRKLKPFPEDVDVRRSKRILTDAELGKLIAATATAPRKGRAAVWGADRAMLYRLAAFSGLRAGELSDLTPAHFKLDAVPPVVTVLAADAKGKREEPIPLPAHVVELLRVWLAGRDVRGRVFPGEWARTRKQCQWLTADLRRAGVDSRNELGQPATFHGLKRRFVVRLIQAGAKIHEVRRLARHTDVKTTLKHYTEENMGELGSLVNRLPPTA